MKLNFSEAVEMRRKTLSAAQLAFLLMMPVLALASEVDRTVLPSPYPD